MEIDLRQPPPRQELVYKDPKTFVIGGDMGDVIYHLLYIKKLGGTTYHIDPCGGPNGGTGYTREGYIRNGDGNPGKFNLTKALFLLPLIKAQNYLEDVDLYRNDPVDSWKFYDVNASEYHKDDLGIRNLTYFHAKKYNLALEDLNEPWLDVPDAITVAPERDVVINRTLRYRGNDNYYFFNREDLNKRGVFVGLPDEYQDFRNRFGTMDIPYVRTHTALELARVIKGHKIFVGNGSLAASIALGLGLDVEYEYCLGASHYLFQRKNITVF
jgi:hypothetical protein